MRILVFLIALMLPAQVLALSCTPWSVEAAYELAANSQQPYVVVRGVIEFDEKTLPIVDFAKQDEVPPHTPIPARMTGKSMTLGGFSRNFDQPVTLAINCAGPWCAKAVSNIPTLAFVERVGDELVIRATPCAPMLFQNAIDELARRALRCFSGGTCKPPTQ